MPNFVGRLNVFINQKHLKCRRNPNRFKVYYFSKFKSRDYFPVLNEFVLSKQWNFYYGRQPIADAYFNMKVKE